MNALRSPLPSGIVRAKAAPVALAALAATSGCVRKPPDFREFRRHEPRSILVLPPQSQSVTVNAPYAYLSTVTMPLAELGYYVIPVGIVDAMLKENGLPTPGEMWTASPAKLHEVFGADAVLYVKITDWGTKYVVLSSNTVVGAKASLVDTATGAELWTGEVHLVQASGGSGNLAVDLVAAAVSQIVNTSTDQAHLLSRAANFQLFHDKTFGLPLGQRHPDARKDNRGRQGGETPPPAAGP